MSKPLLFVFLIAVLQLSNFISIGQNMPFLPNHGIAADTSIKYCSFFTHTRTYICGNKIIYQNLQKDSTAIVSFKSRNPFDRDIYAYNITNIEAEFLNCNMGNTLSGEDATSAYANFFIGNDSNKWSTRVPYYNVVKQTNMYAGIDIRYYINNGDMEYDFNLKPHADLSQIKIQFKGIKQIVQRDSKTIELITNKNRFLYQVPKAYQKNGDNNQEVDISINLLDDSTISFKSNNYNAELALTVDPALKFSTYVGGSSDEFYYGTTKLILDDKHNIYDAGITASTNFPTTAGTYSTAYQGGSQDAFVMKFSGNGNLIFSTFLGGSDIDYGFSLAVYPKTYDVVVTGGTMSSNFPITAGVYQTTFNSAPPNANIFITKLSSTGSAIKFSTYVGGNGDDQGQNILIDSAYDLILAGQSTTLPTTAGTYQPINGGDYDSYILKMDSNATHILAATFVGGADRDRSCGLAIGNNGYYVVGYSTGASFPTTSGAYSTAYAGGGSDIFVYKLSKDLKHLIYSTYIGGSGDDISTSTPILDATGNIIFTAQASSGYPTTTGAYGTTFAGGNLDVGVTKLNSTGSGLIFSTLLGSSGDDGGYAIANDSCGNILVTGYCADGFKYTKGTYDSTYNGGSSDAFIAKFNSNCSQLLYSTYIGGSGTDVAKNIKFDSGYAIIVGQTTSTNYPTTIGAYQTSNAGGEDVFITKLSLNLTANSISIDTGFCVGKSIIANPNSGSSLYLWNTGDTTPTLSINKAGKYWVRFTVAGCSNMTDTFTIKANANPTVNLGNDTTICTGNIVTFNAGNPGSNYLWSTNATTQKVSTSNAGKYWVKVTNTHGCIGSDTVQLNVSPTPVVNLGNDTSVCVGHTIILNAKNPGDKYLWSNSDTTQTIITGTTGKYWVRVTNSFECKASDTLQLTVKPYPVVNLGNDTAFCQGSKIVLKATNIGATYVWNTGAKSSTITVSVAGTYSVNVDLHGCMKSDSINITINPAPMVNLGKDTTLCRGDTIILDAGNAGDKYLWNNNDTTQTIKADSGAYKVQVKNTFGCLGYASIIIQTISLPIVNFGKDTVICPNVQLTLSAGNTGNKYLWNTGNTSSEISVKAGIYWVTVTNQCGIARDTINIAVDNTCCIFAIPNAFTPNHNGINDIYKPISECILDNYLFRIYNRWGQMVFESTDVNIGWDGTFNSQNQPMDVFMWYISYKKHGGSSEFLKGDVTLLR